VLPPFSSSDHSQVEFRVFVEPATAKPTVEAKDSAFRRWKATNVDGMSRYLSAVDWDHL